MPDVTDYGPTIADLERKRDEIDRTIAMLRAFSGLPAVESSNRSDGRAGGPVEFTNKHFFGMSVPDAILMYLDAVKERRSATRIAQDLVEHGLVTTSDTPTEVIRTALRRLDKAGKVVQIKKEWGLPAWYKGLARPARESGTDTEPRKASRNAAAKKSRAGAKRPSSNRKTPERKEKAKAKAGKPNAYATFLGEQMAKGLDMKAAAAAWKEYKAKQG